MPEIQMQVGVAVAPRELFPLVAGATGFERWWTDDVSVQSDGAVLLGFLNRSTVYRLRPETMVMPVRSAWRAESGKEWNGTMIVFELAAGGPGTLVRLTHGGWQAETEYFRECTATWDALLTRLREVAESGATRPMFSGRREDGKEG